MLVRLIMRRGRCWGRVIKELKEINDSRVIRRGQEAGERRATGL